MVFDGTEVPVQYCHGLRRAEWVRFSARASPCQLSSGGQLVEGIVRSSVELGLEGSAAADRAAASQVVSWENP